ncbi:MAG: tRNA epoxyqueuosine(34) reductase QueG [Planctomycetes bacterium]|nr:tRNA epoxyqueuosine(34) reductase QueG [Planctomycetota bacterium]
MAARTAARAREIKKAARSLGFERAGIAAAGPAPDADRLRAWIAAGRAGEMDYLAERIERRIDPRIVVPGARSVIVVARAYPSAPVPSRDPRRARIARFARGRDYHRSVGRDLRRLASALEGRARACVDAGPLIERSWARAAGVAWIGRNACAIVPDLGSYVVLGAIIAIEELAPDPPLDMDGCGTCTACVHACPGGAIVAPNEIDARRCLSYATIESRAVPAPERRAILENRLYGCDACQEACPWNRGRDADPPRDPSPRPEWDAPHLEDLARLDEEAFLARATGTVFRRLGYRRFLRNLLLAIGNARDPSLAGALETVAARRAVCEDPVLRGLSTWAREGA